MFRRLDDFFRVHEQLTTGTGRILDAIPAGKLDQPVAPGHWTLGQTAWHIVVAIPHMMNRVGLSLTAADRSTPVPREPAEIAAVYRRAGGELVEALRANWTDDTLAQTDELFGAHWPRGLTLMALVHHEIHHRGQLSVLLRQAGVRVPGVFGPAKEDWAQLGMQPPEY